MLNFKEFGNFLRILILILSAGQAVSAAQVQRPKVCLVLSGGGARGASHVGVLEVFEREHIPIDCIVGTSFGALAGGLYSVGYSAFEIQRILSSQDWSEIFSDAPQRHLVPVLERRNVRYQIQLSFRNWSLELPPGLWEGQRMTESLDLLTTRQILDAHHDFNRLPVQFRAVATNLLTGEAYIFEKGSMAEALRASMAIPLVFSPVSKNGMLLVDGGLVDNLPTDIARDLDADIVIAVDATSPLLKKDQIHNFINVIDQAISLEMQRNVQANRKLASIILKPDLQKFTANDYNEIPQIITRGQQEAEKRLGEIKSLVSGIPARKHFMPSANVRRIIESISFEGLKKIEPSQLIRQSHLRVRTGHVLNLEALVGDLGRLYATRLFTSVNFRLEPVGNNRYRLIYIVNESSKKTIGLGLRYDNSYNFVALAELTVRQLFQSPSSLVVSTQFGGLEDYFAALHLTPPSAPSLFLEPKAERSKVERLDIRNKKLVDTYTVEREGGQLKVGGSLFRQVEMEGGYRGESVTIQGGSEPLGPPGTSMMSGLEFSLYRDSLNKPEFPHSGVRTQIMIEKQSTDLGSDFDYSKWEANYQRYFPLSNKSTLGLDADAGFTLGSVPFYNLYFIGGYSFAKGASIPFLGLERDEILANQMVILKANYRRRIFSSYLGFVKQGYLEGTYNGLLYSTRQGTPYRFDYLNGGGIGLALRTMFGPVQVMGGWAEGGRVHFYISIGPRF